MSFYQFIEVCLYKSKGMTFSKNYINQSFSSLKTSYHFAHLAQSHGQKVKNITFLH